MTDIVSGAVSDGHDVSVILPTQGPLVGVLQGVGATVFIRPMRAWMGAWHWFPPIGLSRLLQGSRSVPAIEECVHRTRAEVVVTNTSVVPAGASAAARAGVPHIWIVRESLRDNPQLRSVLPKRMIARRVMEGADVLCTISPYVEQQLFGLSGREHPRALRVSPNPSIGQLSAPPPTGGTSRTLLLPGFFSREKGQHRVILGAYLAARRGSKVRVRLVGRGGRGFTALLHALRKVLRVEATVDIAGWTDDLASEYELSHFVLTASRNEAFGRTVVEAFAHGRPVIGLNRGATATLLQDGGGVLVEPSSVRQLGKVIAAVGEMSTVEYEELSRRASERGREFQQSPSQYQAFSAAIAWVEHRASSAGR